MISSPAAESESRRIQRMSLTLPIRVESHVNENIVWNEVTRLNDVSAFGAGFNLSRPVKRGRLIQMTIPMPRKLRSYDFNNPQYKVWGLVRSYITKSNGNAPNTIPSEWLLSGKIRRKIIITIRQCCLIFLTEATELCGRLSMLGAILTKAICRRNCADIRDIRFRLTSLSRC